MYDSESFYMNKYIKYKTKYIYFCKCILTGGKGSKSGKGKKSKDRTNSKKKFELNI